MTKYFLSLAALLVIAAPAYAEDAAPIMDAAEAVVTEAVNSVAETAEVANATETQSGEAVTEEAKEAVSSDVAHATEEAAEAVSTTEAHAGEVVTEASEEATSDVVEAVEESTPAVEPVSAE